MKKLLLLLTLLLPLFGCDQTEEEEDISDLKSMVQAPKPSSEKRTSEQTTR